MQDAQEKAQALLECILNKEVSVALGMLETSYTPMEEDMRKAMASLRVWNKPLFHYLVLDHLREEIQAVRDFGPFKGLVQCLLKHHVIDVGDEDDDGNTALDVLAIWSFHDNIHGECLRMTMGYLYYLGGDYNRKSPATHVTPLQILRFNPLYEYTLHYVGLKRPGHETNFTNLLTTGMCTDISVTVGDRTVKTHREVLMSRSSYFKAFLGNGMVETGAEAVRIEGVDPDIFYEVLTCIYQGFIGGTYPSLEAALDVLDATVHFGVTVSPHMILATIQEMFRPTSYSVFETLRRAKRIHVVELIEACHFYISRHYKSIIRSNPHRMTDEDYIEVVTGITGKAISQEDTTPAFCVMMVTSLCRQGDIPMIRVSRDDEE